VTEAVAFVLSYMPVEEVAAALRTFAMPLVQNIHDLSTAANVGRDEITSICGTSTVSLKLKGGWCARD
jgi:hypothetical protein